MNKKKFAAFAGGVAMTIGLIVAPAGAAMAANDGIRDCGSRFVGVYSTASGRINHEVQSVVTGTWNNGSSAQYRVNSSPFRSGYWRAFLTGVGGNINSSGSTCFN